MVNIVRDPEIRSGDARIEDTRITDLDVKRRIIDGEEDPHIFAGDSDIPIADLYSALSYFYRHRDEFIQSEREHAASRAAGEQRIRETLYANQDATKRAD